MTNPITATTLWVLSDLHLAPTGDLCEFHAHERLVGLLDHIGAQPGKSRLILNGDIFDFLQLPDYDTISLPLAPARMTQILDALADEPPARNIVAALRRLSGGGHALHCLPGNHDPELNLSPVQRILAARLGSVADIAPGQGQWQVHVPGKAKACGLAGGANDAYDPGKLVVGMHGHWKDPFNAISSSAMLAAQSRGDASAPMPPGSRLVRDVINPYRRAIDAGGERRFPFIDLLPSEIAVACALLYLDPALAMRRLCGALQIAPHVFVRAIAKRMDPAGRLAAHGAQDGVDPLLNQLAGALVAAMSDAERQAKDMAHNALLAYLGNDSGSGSASASPARAAPAGMLAADGSSWARRLLLRALCAALPAGRAAFAPSQPDPLATDAIATWGRGLIAITGHTHAAKSIAHGDGALYLNTGTWQDLLRIPDDLTEAAVAVWLEQLQCGQIARWRGCPVARVDGDGAKLLHWDGAALCAWESALAAV